MTDTADPLTARLERCYTGVLNDIMRGLGLRNFVLPPEGIARELSGIASHPFVRTDEATPAQGDESAMKRLTEALRRETGVDFTHYRRNTLGRRILRA